MSLALSDYYYNLRLTSQGGLIGGVSTS